MGVLNKRLESLQAALATLEEILKHRSSVVVRDATIQRFEYTTEAAWKALKHYLQEQEGIECNTPKGCIRAACKANLLNEEETESFMQMINDRNLTSHAYVPEIAQRISSKIPEYARLLRKLYNSMQPSSNEEFESDLEAHALWAWSEMLGSAFEIF